jgi:hypothetical protein
MLRTEETEAIRHRINLIKEKIELKRQGFFEQGSTIEQLKAALEAAEAELGELQIELKEKIYPENFDFRED